MYDISDFNQYIIVNLYQYLDIITNDHHASAQIRTHNTKIISDSLKHMDTLSPSIHVIEGLLGNLIIH